MYAKIESGVITKYPYTRADLCREHPNTSFPIDIMDRADAQSEYGIAPVVLVSRPQKVGWITSEESPELVGSNWTQKWSESPKNVADLVDSEIVKTSPTQDPGYMVVEGDPVLEGDVWVQQWTSLYTGWKEARMNAYGPPHEQIEFITENGLDAWKTKVAEIKALHPKTRTE